ncbi:3-dehydroquinate synthase [Helicobacter burdigaliensis]|uniref:3-dehydroquinate synthase n=1 Tax=Helicobacter burdigaliensis TaxID=2315334 RepID=UPI000EF6EB97|nr:3-dehydroquinate synthase [Helicobacter burdigaliensis]
MDCINLPTYSIHFGALPKLSWNGKVLIITNPKISGLHLKRLLENLDACEIYCICLQDGEKYKNLSSIETILEAAFNHRLNRNSLMIALGGGVIGDMVGFAAGIFMRGIPYIQIPTTLLSQVDSSVGGKTGINNSFGKNLIGLFNPPKAVYIDTHFLQTLPNRELNAGIAEIIKMAICFDKDFFKFLQNADLQNINILQEVIYKAVSIKAKVVLEDEKEKGIRAALNYGHTFGHIIEKLGNFNQFLHGEAVSIGMMMANTLALKLNLISKEEFIEIKNLLCKFNLPITYKIKDIKTFYSYFFLDKKSLDNTIKFILPNKIGNFIIKDDVAEDLLLEILESFQCD